MRWLLTSISLLSCSAAFAQLPISIGVKGGVGLTNAFTRSPVASLNDAVVFSDSKDYIFGPSVEIRLPLTGLSVEADALFRPLHYTTLFKASSLVNFRSSISAWEFPILAKYKFHAPFMRPYVDAGPLFRNVSGTAKGVALGAGVDVKVLLLHVSPELRYEHWGGRFASPDTSSLQQNQVEFLIGLSF